jgi:hypothetical protein
MYLDKSQTTFVRKREYVTIERKPKGAMKNLKEHARTKNLRNA